MVDVDIEWRNLNAFTVRYPKDDLFGKFLALVSLFPYAIVVAYVTLIIFNRELETIFMFFGQLLNEFICYLLKNTIRQQRPSHENLYLKLFEKDNHGFGMPSQHVQFQTYFTTYCILYLFLKTKKSSFFKTSISLGLILSCFMIIYSRIYLFYHFWYQCLVGLIIGIIWAFIWFKINLKIFDKCSNYIILWKISKYFNLVYKKNG